MRWNDYRRSSNVSNRRGEGGRAGGGMGGAGGAGMLMMGARLIFSRFGIKGIIIAAVAFFGLSMLGLNPLMGSGGQSVTSSTDGTAPTSRFDEEITAILATTEDVWTTAFAEQGGTYRAPNLNLFSGGITTNGCGYAGSQVGPFYCPGDEDIYIDTSFFDQLDRQLGAPGDFARAYVIAHEVGHHIQTITGVSDEVRSQQARAGSKAQQNEYQVRMELMADCLAGVWARRAQSLDGFSLEEGDLQEGLRAANAIGDDTLSGGRARPESFTHGSAEQRQRWLQIGYRSGDMQACNTLEVGQL